MDFLLRRAGDGRRSGLARNPLLGAGELLMRRDQQGAVLGQRDAGRTLVGIAAQNGGNGPSGSEAARIVEVKTDGNVD